MDESSSFLMEKLRAKGGTYKSFKEYAKSLRMTLMEKRYALEISEKSYLQECLDLLQQNILVSTLPAVIERLEVISRHLGLKFVSGPSRLEWFISSDMFYVEVVLEPNGHIKDVKIHHDGTGERQSCEELKTTLENRDFKDFTVQLEGLISIYNLNADQKVKSKAFSSLQYLESDIIQLSNLQYSFTNDHFNIIHKSNVGLVQKRRGGHPMKIIYFISPYDLLDITKKIYKPLTLDLPEVDYSISLCLESSSTNKLQTQNLVKIIKSEKIDENNDMEQPTTLFEELTATNTNLLPACFVMKLKTRMPICEGLINQMKEITDIEVSKIEGPLPILSLIKREIHKKFIECEEDSSIVTLPDQRHCYIMTNNYDLQAYIVQSIPFSHPSHIPKILPLLRQQALFNSFIASCIQPKVGEDSCDKLNQNFSEIMQCDSEYTNGFGLKLFGSEDFKSLGIFNESPQKSASSHVTMFEVMPLSLQLITVSFEHPIDETLITAELDLSDVSDLRCNISMASEDSNTSVSNAQECAGRALQRSFSIPATMRVLIRLWESQTDTSDEEDLNESNANNDITDLSENAENNMETENGKENKDCPSEEFNSGVTMKMETSDSCENSLDGFPSLTNRNGEFCADDVFATPNPSLRYQSFDPAEILPSSNTFTDTSISFLDNANEQPMFEPKNENANLMENSFFKSKSCVTDLFIPKGQRMNDCEIVIDSSSDSEPSETMVVAAAAAAAAAAHKEVITDSRDPSPGSNSSLEFSALTDLTSDTPNEKSHSNFDIDHSMMEVNNLEDVQQFLKLTENKISKNEEINGGSKSFGSSILSDLDGKNLVSPSVSITPLTTATPPSSSSSVNTQQCNQNLQNVLSSMCLDRRPGIDVSMTPFTPSPPSLPASLTITPINVKETSDNRVKERKSQKIKSGSDDKARLEKKKKRKHDDSPMGPPEKIPTKSDPLLRPVSVSIKPTGGSGELASPRSPPACNATQRKFTVSPTHSASLSLLGKISPNSNTSGTTSGSNNVKSCKSQGSVGGATATSLTSSPKMCITTPNVSPKQSITSPKNVSSGSSGKPSMSALKSVVTSPSSSSKSNNDIKSKSHKDVSVREYKEKKNSSNSGSGSGCSGAGHQSPKPKSSNLKVNKIDGVKLSAVIDRLTNSKSEDSCKNGNGKSSSSSNSKDVKNNTQLTDVKGNQSLAKTSQEYIIKHHDDGMKMTFNRTRIRDSGTNKTGSIKNSVAPGNDSPKHTALKQSTSATTIVPGGSNTICKKSTSLNKTATSTTLSNKTSSSISSKHSSKSSTSSSKSKSNHSPKGSHTLDPNRKEKIRPPKIHSLDKSIFANAPKRVNPTTMSDFGDVDKPYKPPYQPPLVYSTKPLDTKFQIPKISDRNKMSGSENEIKKSLDVTASADNDCTKDGLTKTDSSSPIKIPFASLEERGILIEATKNTNSSYETSKSKSAVINENSLELISNPTSQHQMTSNCNITGVPSSDSIKLNLAKFHSRYDVIGRPAEFEYSACE